MSDGPERSVISRRRNETGAVTSLASEALSVLATRRQSNNDRVTAPLIDKLERAVVDRDPTRRTAVIEEMRALRISPARITEEFIPEVARRLGARWCDDNMSFADVTIGSARLQAMVRDLSPREDEEDGPRQTALLAVIVPGGEYHTLGAMVMASQIRRLGFAVRLFLGKDDAEVIDALALDRFDAVLLTAARGEKLVNLAGFVKKIRQAVTRATPIVVGGPVVTRGLANERRIGADYITSDIHEALSACGLKTSHEDDKRHETTEMISPAP